MASTGAQCDHVNHVSTQLPYAMTVAAVSALGYLLAGVVQNVFVVLGVSVAAMIGVLIVLRLVFGNDNKNALSLRNEAKAGAAVKTESAKAKKK